MVAMPSHSAAVKHLCVSRGFAACRRSVFFAHAEVEVSAEGTSVLHTYGLDGHVLPEEQFEVCIHVSLSPTVSKCSDLLKRGHSVPVLHVCVFLLSLCLNIGLHA